MNTLERSSFRFSALVILVFATCLQACNEMLPGYEKPTVTVSKFRALPSDGGAIPNFEIDLHIINPNREALALKGVSYTISLGGHELIKGVANKLPVIEAYGEGDLTLTATANLVAGIQLVSELINSPADTMTYEFDAKLDNGLFRRAIRVRDAGEILLRGDRSN